MVSWVNYADFWMQADLVVATRHAINNSVTITSYLLPKFITSLLWLISLLPMPKQRHIVGQISRHIRTHLAISDMLDFGPVRVDSFHAAPSTCN